MFCPLAGRHAGPFSALVLLVVSVAPEALKGIQGLKCPGGDTGCVSEVGVATRRLVEVKKPRVRRVCRRHLGLRPSPSEVSIFRMCRPLVVRRGNAALTHEA